MTTSDEKFFFKDQTESSGITFRLENFPTNERYLIETMTGGCAFLDYDVDGVLDVFLVNGAATVTKLGKPGIDKSDPRYWNRLYHGLGNGQFQDVAEQAGIGGKGYGMGVAVGDYDNDGYPDVYVTNYGQNELYHNEGNGTFRDVTAKAGVAAGDWSSSAAFFDFNRDGLLDLYVCRYVDWGLSNHKYCALSEQRDYCHPRHFRGVPDLLYKNNGDGTFTDVSAEAGIALSAGKGLGIAVNDFNRDNWPDVYIANDSVPSFLFQNEQGKSFKEIGLSSAAALNESGSPFAGMGVDFADYDNDGWPDVIVTALSLEGFVLFRNSGDGTFSDVSDLTGVRKASYHLSGWGTKFIDFDNDGWKDLFVANGHVMLTIGEAVRTMSYAQPMLMLRNEKGHFRDITAGMGPTFTEKRAARGAAFGDYENDGDVDILVSVLGNAPVLLRNIRGNRNNWIGFQLTGTKSSRDAIGATLKVTDSEGSEQYYRVSRTSSYLSSNDPRILVGLGNRTVVSAEITWPSGYSQKVSHMPVNRYVRVVEGKENR